MVGRTSLGYDVTLVGDAHGTRDGDLLSAAQIVAHHNEVLGNSFADVVEAGEVDLKEMVGG